MIVKEILPWSALDKHLGFFQYFNSFRFREFPSALRNIASFKDKPINFNCFFKSYLPDHESHLILQQTN